MPVVKANKLLMSSRLVSTSLSHAHTRPPELNT